jgi:hypothetical protein
VLTLAIGISRSRFGTATGLKPGLDGCPVGLIQAVRSTSRKATTCTRLGQQIWVAKAWMHMRKLDRNSLRKAGALAPLDFLEEIYWLKLSKTAGIQIVWISFSSWKESLWKMTTVTVTQ